MLAADEGGTIGCCASGFVRMREGAWVELDAVEAVGEGMLDLAALWPPSRSRRRRAADEQGVSDCGGGGSIEQAPRAPVRREARR